MAVSTIGPQTTVRGNVHGEGDVQIEGCVEGDVSVEGNVVVTPSGTVKGSIAGATVVVSGSVEGDISSADALTLDADARVTGDMKSPRIQIAEGAQVRGLVHTEGEARSPNRDKRRNARPAQPHAKEREPAPPPLPKPQTELAAQQAAEHPRDEPVRDKTKKKRKDKDKHKRKRPPDPVVPVLAKRTKGKKKANRSAHTSSRRSPACDPQLYQRRYAHHPEPLRQMPWRRPRRRRPVDAYL
jgi:cytoskeletal protein CcmA (bactofilin family)